jgi:hypothetical protein
LQVFSVVLRILSVPVSCGTVLSIKKHAQARCLFVPDLIA